MIAFVVERTWSSGDEFPSLQTSSHIEIIPDLIDSSVPTADCSWCIMTAL